MQAPIALNLEAVGQRLEAPEFTYDWKTCATYALGIGAGTDELPYVWEAAPQFNVYPGFAVLPVHGIVMEALARVRADFRTLVHGEQTVRLHKPFSREGTLRSTGGVTACCGGGSGATTAS